MLPLLLLIADVGVSQAAPRTAEAVIAADDAWLQAEVAGDAKALEQLLLPGYRSVGASGSVTSGEQLVEKARGRGADPAVKAGVADWKARHPVTPKVALIGDTAVLTWVLPGPGGDVVTSSDIFVYRGGRWHALYSQHSDAAK